MSHIATTKLSSKGQVVIPENIRKKLKLTTGVRFVVLGDKDVVVFKKISEPAIDEFGELVREARKAARKVGLKKSDIKAAIIRARTSE